MQSKQANEELASQLKLRLAQLSPSLFLSLSHLDVPFDLLLILIFKLTQPLCNLLNKILNVSLEFGNCQNMDIFYISHVLFNSIKIWNLLSTPECDQSCPWLILLLLPLWWLNIQWVILERASLLNNILGRESTELFENKNHSNKKQNLQTEQTMKAWKTGHVDQQGKWCRWGCQFL